MSYYPLNYEQINVSAGTYNPSSIKKYDNESFSFWCRSLFQRACSTLEFTLPDEWDGKVKDFFMWCLFKFGYVAVSNNPQFGYFFQPCTLSGFDFYYQPFWAVISNPAYTATLEIGKECELLKLTPDYYGIFDIIERYAGFLSELDNATNMSIINSKLAWIIGVRNKTAAAAIKKALDEVNKGNPAVCLDVNIVQGSDRNNPPYELIDFGNIKEKYITSDQLQDLQTILNNFDSEVGIPTIPYAKKERMVTSEADSRQIDSTSRSIVWFDTLKSSIDSIKKLYPDIKLEVKRRFDEPAEDPEAMPEEGEDTDENND